MKLSAKQYAQLWHDSLLRVETDADRAAVSEAMLRRILKDGAYRELSSVVRALEGLASKEQSMEDVTVISARPVEASSAKKIVSDLLGHQRFAIQYKQDPSLIGGLVVQTRDARWDLSLKRQIRRLQEAVIA